MDHQVFEWEIRVYLEDTDAFGFVYHSNYLCYAERARTEMMYAIGINIAQMMRDENFAFVVRNAKIHHKRPAVLGDVMKVMTYLEYLKGARCVVRQIFKVKDLEVADVSIEIVCINHQTNKPMKWPVSIAQKLMPYELQKAA